MDEVTIDPRHPWQVQVHRLGRQPGCSAELAQVAHPDGHWGSDVVALDPPDSIEVDLRLEAVGEGVLVSGQANASAHGECIRCLEPVELALQVPIQELFTYDDTRSTRQGQARQTAGSHNAKRKSEAGSSAAAPGEDEVEQPPLIHDQIIDLLPTVRDAMVLALPTQPLCSPDCPGLCPQCGVRLVEDPQHDHGLVDPRWSALADLQNRQPGQPNQQG